MAERQRVRGLAFGADVTLNDLMYVFGWPPKMGVHVILPLFFWELRTKHALTLSRLASVDGEDSVLRRSRVQGAEDRATLETLCR